MCHPHIVHKTIEDKRYNERFIIILEVILKTFRLHQNSSYPVNKIPTDFLNAKKKRLYICNVTTFYRKESLLHASTSSGRGDYLLLLLSFLIQSIPLFYFISFSQHKVVHFLFSYLSF